MGKHKHKQKLTSHHTHKDHCSSSKSTAIRCSSNMELLSDERPSHSGDHGVLPLPGVLDITDRSMKLLNTHPAMAHHHHHHHQHHHQHQQQHHQSLGRSIFLKRSRYHYGNQYSRRNSSNHASASSSRGRGTSSFDDKLSFKVASQPSTLPRQHAEYKEKTFSKPERIYDVDSVSPDVGKMVCGICQKQLRRKFNFLRNSMSCNELSVVSVLVCGHIYHADCLEQRTSLDEQRDPSCPMCADLHLQAHNSKEQE